MLEKTKQSIRALYVSWLVDHKDKDKIMEKLIELTREKKFQWTIKVAFPAKLVGRYGEAYAEIDIGFLGGARSLTINGLELKIRRREINKLVDVIREEQIGPATKEVGDEKKARFQEARNAILAS